MNPSADVKVHVRFKLSALWVSLMFCFVYNDYFQLFQPGQLHAMLGGLMGGFAVTQGALLVAAVLLAIPATMIFLSLVLNPAAARWLNLVFAALYTIIDILTMIGAWWYYIFFNGIETALTLAIVWYAWNWRSVPAPSR